MKIIMPKATCYLATLVTSGILAFAGASSSALAGDGVKLGVLNDLSGAFADLGGRGSIIAAELAIEDFGGEILGQKIEIISADTQNKPDVATAIARQWFDVEGVDVIVDPVPSSVALGIQELIKDRKKISIIASSGLDLTGEFCTSTSFQWAYDTSVLAKGTAAAMVDEGLKDWYFVTADVAFGHSLAGYSKAVIDQNGGTVVGESRHPYLTQDFTSFLLQAQTSGAEVIALANSGTDTTNSIKQAMEFGVSESARVVALLAFITDVKSIGLDIAQGLVLTESFYWDMNDETRAWSERFSSRMGGGQMPSMAHAGIYSGIMHYLKAVEALGSKDAQLVADKMRELPINDFMTSNGIARKDGRIVRDFYLFEVKSPEESSGPWDLYKLIRTIPAAEVTPPEGSTGCPL